MANPPFIDIFLIETFICRFPSHKNIRQVAGHGRFEEGSVHYRFAHLNGAPEMR